MNTLDTLYAAYIRSEATQRGVPFSSVVSAYARMDADKCGRGWVGLKGKCKRSKAAAEMSSADKKAWVSELKSANSKDDRLALANKIRKERGLSEIPIKGQSTPPKAEPKPKRKSRAKAKPKAEDIPMPDFEMAEEADFESMEPVKPKRSKATPKPKGETIPKRPKPEPKEATAPEFEEVADLELDPVEPPAKPKDTSGEYQGESDPNLKLGTAVIAERKAGRKDGKPYFAPKNIDQFAEQTGLPKSEAKKQWEAVTDYSGDSLYAPIRNAQQAGDKGNPRFRAIAEQAEAFVRNSNPFKGRIYRGMALRSLDEVSQIFKPGEEFTTDSLTSFTSDKKVTSDFMKAGEKDGRNHRVLVTVKQNKSGASIRNASYSPREEEILVTSGTRYRISSVSEPTSHKSRKGSYTMTKVVLEEIIDD